MAAEIQMGGVATDRIFLGTDFTRDFEVLDIDTDDTGATAKDVAGWAVTLDIRPKDTSSAAKLTASLTVVGSFNSVASSNTQRLRWTCADTDLTTALFTSDGGTYRYSVKRTDDGLETILQYGDVVIERATQA